MRSVEESLEFVRAHIRDALKGFIGQTTRPSMIEAVKQQIKSTIHDLEARGKISGERPEIDVQVDPNDPTSLLLIPLNKAGEDLLWLTHSFRDEPDLGP